MWKLLFIVPFVYLQCIANSWPMDWLYFQMFPEFTCYFYCVHYHSGLLSSLTGLLHRLVTGLSISSLDPHTIIQIYLVDRVIFLKCQSDCINFPMYLGKKSKILTSVCKIHASLENDFPSPNPLHHSDLFQCFAFAMLVSFWALLPLLPKFYPLLIGQVLVNL